MPVYTYRREDGTTFEIKQKFTDDPLEIDPVSGQRVQRVVQAAGVIFKGQGFYVNDSKSASKASVNGVSKPSETKTEAAPAKDATSTPSSAPAPAAPASAAS
ncbi:MAG: zinc ribbon domain-containing protein [Anaerolineae bacterium]